MRLHGRWYYADKGKHFVLTEKGKANVASYKNKTVGEPVSDYSTEAVDYDVKHEYLVEVDIPNWIVKTGYEVVYDTNAGATLYAGNKIIFPDRFFAERYKKHYEAYPWNDHELYIRESVFEGTLTECRTHDGKTVYNKDWYFGTACLEIGDYIEGDIVSYLINCVPAACTRSSCMQCGEAADTKADGDGVYRNTYATFKRVTKDIYEYCGNCFRGSNKAA